MLKLRQSVRRYSGSAPSDIVILVPGVLSIFRFDDAAGKVYGDAIPPQELFYNLLYAKEATYWSERLSFSSFAALNATATYIPYSGDFQVVYVICRQDRAVT